MVVRQCGYAIVPGQEHTAIEVCHCLIDTLRERGVRAQALVGGKGDSTLQVIEEYDSAEAMEATRVALEGDSTYRAALTAWATAFYPLVREVTPALVLRGHHAA